MEDSLCRAIEAAIAATGEGEASIASSDAVAGTSFDRATVLTLRDQRRFFVKLAPLSAARRFAAEAEGLRALAEPGILRLPRWVVAGADAAAGDAFIAMEAIPRGDREAVAWASLGEQLAEHHRQTLDERFGFSVDNHCGATPQPNAWQPDGTSFWRLRRLGHQLQLARENGVADAELSRAGDRLLARLDDFLDPQAVACLIHGDLWSGNVIVDASPSADGEDCGPAVVDPAVYFGDREAELAMCRLFGGFPPAFFDAYEAVWPLPPEAGERQPIFTLYHLLNHLNLFGSGYRHACLEILRRFG